MAQIAMDERSAPAGRIQVIAIWTLSSIAALAFLAAGGAKLFGAAPMVAEFDKLGAGQWFRYWTGLLEVMGAITILIPRYAFYGAILLTAVMLGAIAAHLLVLGGSPVVPIVLLLVTGTVAFLRRQRERFVAE